MEKNTTKVKLIFLLAIALIVALFAISIIQVVSIYKKNQVLANQQQQIKELEDKLSYYENDDDDKQSDSEIVPEVN